MRCHPDNVKQWNFVHFGFVQNKVWSLLESYTKMKCCFNVFEVINYLLTFKFRDACCLSLVFLRFYEEFTFFSRFDCSYLTNVQQSFISALNGRLYSLKWQMLPCAGQYTKGIETNIISCHVSLPSQSWATLERGTIYSWEPFCSLYRVWENFHAIIFLVTLKTYSYTLYKKKAVFSPETFERQHKWICPTEF